MTDSKPPDFGTTPPGVLLAKMLGLEPPVIEGKWFHQQTLDLDGYHYKKCRFDSCRLNLTKGTFVIERCYFGNCGFTYMGESGNVARLINLWFATSKPELYQQIAKLCPTLLPTFHADDATVSIGGAAS